MKYRAKGAYTVNPMEDAMRRKVAAVAGLVIAGVVIAGCSSGQGDNSADGADSASSVEVFTWWASGSEKVGLDALVSVFNEQYPDVEFVNAAVAGGAGSNAKAALASRLEASNPPDTFQAHAGAELSDYIAAGQIQDLSGLYEELDLYGVFPGTLIEQMTVDGKIYSVPSNIHRANVTWVNTEVLEGAGIDPTAAPADMDAWIADLEKLRDAGVESPLSLGTEWTQVHLLETVLLAELGPSGYSGLWDGTTAWDSSGVRSAVDHYATLLSYANTDYAGLDWDAATQIVIDDAAGYNVMGDWAEAAFVQAGEEYGVDYTTWAVPGTEGVFDFLADAFTLTVGAPDEQSAKAWLTTISSAEGQKAFNLAKGSIPARTDADPADYPAYQQTAIASFASDTIVSSLAHGAAASIAWSGDISSAVGKFGSDGDKEAFISGLAAAAAKSLG